MFLTLEGTKLVQVLVCLVVCTTSIVREAIENRKSNVST